MTTTLRLMLRDRLVWAGLAIWAAAALVLALAALLPASPAAAAVVLVDPVLLAVSFAALAASRVRVSRPRERRFWDLLATAWLCWLVVEFFYFVELSIPFVSTSFAADALYVLFYLSLLLAVEVRPHLRDERPFALTRQRVESIAGLLATFGLWIYFALVDLPEPLGLSLSFVSRDWGLLPYLLVRLSLDLVLLGRLVYAARTARGRWPGLYLLLAAAMLGYALRDGGLLLQTRQAAADAAPGVGWSLFLLLPGLLVVLAARYRHLPFPDAEREAPVVSAEDEDMLRTSPVALYMLVVPALHFVLYPLELLEESSRGAREIFCLIYVVVVGLVAAIHLKIVEAERRRAVAALYGEISERKRVNRELETRQAEMERFSYTISHELKAPLVTIIGFAGVLEQELERAEPERLKKDLDRIRSAAGGMRRLLGDLLELSRAGWTTERREPVSMTRVAESACDKLALDTQELQAKVSIEPGLPVVQGDATRLEEVFTNLIANAAKFGLPDRTPEVRIGCRRGQETVFYVADNGRGIDPRFHAKVFGLFDRIYPEVEGTGVGLALVKRIIEKHGGRTWVESEGEGKGATFCFTIPEPEPGGAQARERPLRLP